MLDNGKTYLLFNCNLIILNNTIIILKAVKKEIKSKLIKTEENWYLLNAPENILIKKRII